MNWNNYTHVEINRIVFNAFEENASCKSIGILGLPGTYLDRETFYEDAPFLKDAPLVSTLITNSNHIGCHMLIGNNHEDVFRSVFNFKYLPCT